jgi:hypothetical protein
VQNQIVRFLVKVLLAIVLKGIAAAEATAWPIELLILKYAER